MALTRRNPATKRSNSKQFNWFFPIVILIVLGFILGTGSYLRNAAISPLDEETNLEINATTSRLQTQMGNYIQSLYGSRALMSAQPNTSRLQWQKFYLNNGNVENLPSFGLMAFMRRVPASQKTAFVSGVKNDTSITPDGYPNFSIHPDVVKDEYFVIDYIEPFNLTTQQQSFGFDYSSDPTRRAAYEKARDTNSPIMTNPMKSLSASATVLVIVLPVYNQALPQLTPDQRRAAFQGFTALGIRTQDFFDESFKDLSKDISVEVYDGTEISPDHRLYDSNKEMKVLGASSQIKTHVEVRTILAADRTWTLVFKHKEPLSDFLLLKNFYSRIAALLVTNLACAILVWRLARKQRK